MERALLLLLVLSTSTPAQEPEPASLRYELGKAAVEVGEPVVWSLHVEHLADLDVVIDPAGPVLSDPWLSLEVDELLVRSLADGRLARELTGRAICLEPGEHELVAPAVVIGGQPQGVSPLVVEVGGVLAAQEDAPRPLRGFRPTPPEQEPAPAARWPWYLGGGLGGLALLALAWWGARMRRARAVAEPVEPSALERLAAVEARTHGEPDSQREAHFELVQLVRQRIDQGQQRRRSAHDEEHWLEDARAELAPELGDDLVVLFERCHAVCWAGEAPTRWAIDETLALARDLLERLPRQEVTA